MRNFILRALARINFTAFWILAAGLDSTRSIIPVVLMGVCMSYIWLYGEANNWDPEIM